MSVSVFSEIGPLRKVMVHAPGPEVDCMHPETMHELLFDDIIYGDRSRHEHQRFRAVMRAFGIEVVDSADLLAQALAATPQCIPGLLADLQALEGLGPEAMEELSGMGPAALRDALIQGRAPHAGLGAQDPLLRVSPGPIPNLLFSRDAVISLGDGVVVGSMHARARQREPLLVRTIFKHHPDFVGTRFVADFSARRSNPTHPFAAAATVEGGDVLVLREGIVLCGSSQRTMEHTVDRLVNRLRSEGTFKALIMLQMPSVRHAMHLDTIFTRTSESECLVYAPMIVEGGLQTISAITIDLQNSDDHGRRHPSLLAALRNLGVDLEPIYCGGRRSFVQQAREQWTDGANSFALAPGVILLYGRNLATADELARAGYRLVKVGDLPFDADGSCLEVFDPSKKTAILVEGNELSRARGGPRCMTMPLWRDAV